MQRTGTHGRRLIAALPVIVLILLILVDQLTKLYFHLYGVKGKDITVIPGFFYLNFSTNTGAVFGSLSDKEWAQVFFKITTALALIGLTVFYYFAADHGNWLKYGLILVIGGAVGNFIDRLCFSEVVDFLSFDFGWLGAGRFATFNFADSFLCVGVAMILIHYLFLDKDAVFRFKKHEN